MNFEYECNVLYTFQRAKKIQPNVDISRSMTKSGAEVLVYTPQKRSAPPGPACGQSPPVRDPGPKAGSKLSQEIRRLQKELGTCVQRIEQLANKGKFQLMFNFQVLFAMMLQ